MDPRLPNFLVIGAPKSGTTSLFHYLSQHPDVYLPVRKELHYFSYAQIAANVAGPRDDVVLPALCAGREEYERHYSDVDRQRAVGEISPSYLYYDEVRESILRELGRVRIVVLLRNPVDKAFSQYMHLVRDGRESLSFAGGLHAEQHRREQHWSDLWRYAESSLYAERVANYIATFGRENVRVYLFDDLTERPDDVMHDLFEFLELDPGVRCDTSRVYNRSGVSRSRLLSAFMAEHNPLKTALKRVVPERLRVRLRERILSWNTGAKPEMEPDVRRRLTRFFRDDAARLAELLEQSLPWGE